MIGAADRLPLPDLTSLTPGEIVVFAVLALICLATFFMSSSVEKAEKERQKKIKEQKKKSGQQSNISENAAREEIDELNGNIMM